MTHEGYTGNSSACFVNAVSSQASVYRVQMFLKHDNTVGSLYGLDFEHDNWIFLCDCVRVLRCDKLIEI
jgi:hypothetical protein